MEGLYTLICQVSNSPTVLVKGIQACGSMQEQQLLWHQSLVSPCALNDWQHFWEVLFLQLMGSQSAVGDRCASLARGYAQVFALVQ